MTTATVRFLKPDMSKLNRAAKVLKAVRIPRIEGLGAWVNAFNNCREQGYTLVVDAGPRAYRWFTFCEYRNSDDIVVYSGTGYPPPSGVDDASYATKRFFPTEEAAAAFIAAEVTAHA